jgi:protein O-GlcNAc transferase
MVQDHLKSPLAALLAGDDEAAIAAYRAQIVAAPANVEARYGLASALAALGDGAAASVALEEARMLQGLLLAKAAGADLTRIEADGDYAAAVATELYAAHHVAGASVIWGRAILAGHPSATGLISYALSLQHQGRAEDALGVFRAAAELYPSATVDQFGLFPNFMVENGPARYAAAARAWAERWTPETENPVFANPPSEGRRLRIGYVSPAFGATQLRQFITPILEAHDPAAVSVFLYPATDEHEKAWPGHIAVRPIGSLSDQDAAALIRHDGIDVLIDCWGHSAGSRLGVFARRAAPVQVAWINFVQTTGLGRMDYVLHADTMAAPGTAALFTETVLSMGEVIIPYRPHPDRPPVALTPALQQGHVTFGSFNHPAKLSDATVNAWARVLKGAPDSRLLLKYRYFVDPVLQSVTRARFAAERVDPGRIDFQGQSEGAEYLASYAQVDLFLDPSPCPGGTTTCDALAAGVPVLTLAGPDFYSRIGILCVRAAGLADLVADSWDDYVACAVRLSQDVAALDTLRAGVRPGLEAGPLRDEAGFVRRLEATFRDLFGRWLGEGAVRGAA